VDDILNYSKLWDIDENGSKLLNDAAEDAKTDMDSWVITNKVWTPFFNRVKTSVPNLTH